MDQFEKRRRAIEAHSPELQFGWSMRLGTAQLYDGCTLLVEPLSLERRYPSKGANVKTVELVLAAREPRTFGRLR